MVERHCITTLATHAPSVSSVLVQPKPKPPRRNRCGVTQREELCTGLRVRSDEVTGAFACTAVEANAIGVVDALA
jgi:hypothetical protein